jgi:hypothetical protein
MSIPGFLLCYYVTLPFTFGVMAFAKMFSTGRNSWATIFSLVHLPILFFVRDEFDFVWVLLTVLHGLAHILYPALIGVNFNKEYDPIYDYFVHAAQCLCVAYYHPTLMPLGIFCAMAMMVGSAIGREDGRIHTTMNKGADVVPLPGFFFTTKMWLMCSAFGVFGTIYHMMLLNKTADPALFYAGIFIWLSPYFGYLVPGKIPVWDSIMNKIGLFQCWYLNWFIAQYIYSFI